jgi:hypothetical protein
MFIAGIFSLFFRFILLCVGVGSMHGASRGDLHAAFTMLVVVALWNWRRILDYVAERRRRY